MIQRWRATSKDGQMTRTLTLLAWLAPVLVAGAASVEAPQGWGFVGQPNAGYGIQLDESPFGQASLLIHSNNRADGSFGGIGQNISAATFAGQRIRLTARVRTEDVNGWTGLWLRLDDGAGKVLLLDNMSDRGVYGTRPWLRQHIVVDVPAETLRIAFGAILSGTGKAWLDDFELVAAPDASPVTAHASERVIYNEASAPSLPAAPLNGDFEA